jgi:hypothetical protein
MQWFYGLISFEADQSVDYFESNWTGLGIQIADSSSPNGFARLSSAHTPTQAQMIASSLSS